MVNMAAFLEVTMNDIATPDYSDEQIAAMRKKARKTALILLVVVLMGFFGVMYFQTQRVKSGYGLGLGVLQWMGNNAVPYR
jgi:hypothetical protein